LGPLPDSAADYCSEYMSAVGIKEFYDCKYDAKSSEFWKKIELPDGADVEYVCIGVKASNYFMPKETLSDKGPGGGGWIHFNKHMQVTKKDGTVWGDGTVFAVGDCNYGCLGSPPNWEMPPVPKISYPGEEQAPGIHGPAPKRCTGVWCTKCQMRMPMQPFLHSLIFVDSMSSFWSAAGIHQFTM